MIHPIPAPLQQLVGQAGGLRRVVNPPFFPDIALSELCPGEADRLLNDVCSATGEHAQILAPEQYLVRKFANDVRAVEGINPVEHSRSLAAAIEN